MKLNPLLLFALLITNSLCFEAFAFQSMFIYETPTGDKMVTDRRIHLEGYKLIHFSGSARETGEVLRSSSYKISDLERFIRNASQDYGVDQHLIKAVIRAESNFDTRAISHKGARGLMQLMPGTAIKYQIHTTELFDPEKNIEAGTKHLRFLLSLFNNKTELALAAYNAGEHRVKQYGGIPPYRETQTYVARVMKFWKDYQ